MKFVYTRMLVTSGWLLTIATPGMAATNYSPQQCASIADEIVLGKRPPLTDQEMRSLDSDTIERLTTDLAVARQRHQQDHHLPDRSPVLKAPNPTADSGQAPGATTNSSPEEDHHDLNNGSVSEETPLAPLSDQQQAFIQEIAPDAQQVAAGHDLYASVLIAQAILESNWGTSSLAKEHHNLFGIKGAFQGMSTVMPTDENINGRNLQVQASFRHYGNVKQSLLDYAELLNQPLYANTHKSLCQDYTEATHHLNGVYATDPNYQHKLNRLIKSYHLTKYDQSVVGQHHPQVDHQNNKSISSKETFSKQLPTDLHPQHKKQQKKGLVVPLLSGIGSMSLVEIIRRWIK